MRYASDVVSTGPASRRSVEIADVEAEEPTAVDAVRRLLSRSHMLLPGLYAWVATVATPVTMRGAPLSAQVSAFGALICLAAGPFVAFERPRIGRAIGVWGFVGLCLLTWVLVGNLVSIQKVDPVRAALGGVGWALYAFGWGSVRRFDNVPEDDPRAILGDRLKARGKLPRGAAVVLSISVAGALVPLFLAWRVDRAGHSLLAHAVAILCAIAMLSAGARVAVGRGKWKPVKPPRLRINAAKHSLALLSLALGFGLVALLLS